MHCTRDLNRYWIILVKLLSFICLVYTQKCCRFDRDRIQTIDLQIKSNALQTKLGVQVGSNVEYFRAQCSSFDICIHVVF